MRVLVLFWALVTACFVHSALFAGELDSTAPPGETGSYTLEDIWNRLSYGTVSSQSFFTEPTSGPDTGTGHTLNEIMSIAPKADNTDGASPEDVLSGKTFWGLTDGAWGLQTGSSTTQTVNNATVNQPAGNYAAFDLSAVDTDLSSENIKSGTTIFGVAGNSNVVNTSAGTAAAVDIAAGKVAFVGGEQITGVGVTLSYPAPVEKSGQTSCWDESGNSISCTETAQDGEYQKGVAFPSPRFIDNEDGTVTDNLTGLIWLKDAYCLKEKEWITALSDCKILENGVCGLTDGSSAGDWRLPNTKELYSLVHLEYSYPALSNAAGTARWTAGNPFTNVRSGNYWTATTYDGITSEAWYVNVNYGTVEHDYKWCTYYIFPVRDGQ